MGKKYFQRSPPKKVCSCGATMKQRSRINYPFGKKSKSQKTVYFKCVRCGEKT